MNKLVRQALHLLLLLSCGLSSVQAQVTAATTQRYYRIGMITYAGEPNNNVGSTGLVLKRELARLGYQEGVNVTFMERAGNRSYAATQGAAAELVAWQPDVVISFMSNADLAMQEATLKSQTPVVFWATDPLEEKLIHSYRHPGTHFTGFSYEPYMQLLQVRVLKLLVPKLKRLCHLYNHTYSPAPSTLRELRSVTDLFKMQLKVYEVLDAANFDKTFAAMHADRCDAVHVGPHELFNTNGAKLGELVQKYKLPALGMPSLVRAGGVATYEAPFERGWPAMAQVVDKILKGARPADIPVERAFKSPLILNLRAIKALGLTVPASLLDEADEVIQ